MFTHGTSWELRRAYLVLCRTPRDVCSGSANPDVDTRDEKWKAMVTHPVNHPFQVHQSALCTVHQHCHLSHQATTYQATESSHKLVD
jgi:hypothetical protein